MGRRLRFEWDKANQEHIAQHGVTTDEVEEVFSRPVFEIPSNRNEPRNRCVGPTAQGRMLAIAYTMRAGNVPVVTAYPASRKLRRQYAETIVKEGNE
jgi:uncharacterized DUF497 family protein